MMPFATQEHLKDAWEYGIKKVSAKTNPMNKYTVKGSQFEQPLLEVLRCLRRLRRNSVC